MKIISIGDRFEQGRFDSVHSRFAGVINFAKGAQIVSIVSPEIGAGPFRMVMEGLDTETINVLELTQQKIIINDEMQYSYSDKQIYKSEWEMDGIDPEKIQENITLIKNTLDAAKKNESLLFLLSDEQKSRSESAFDKELIGQFRYAYKQLLNHEFEQAALGFKGRGYGLTPAGDDFNAGLLLGLQLRSQAEQKELSKRRSDIYHNSLGHNPLANTFLLQAYRGWYDAKWKDLLTELCGMGRYVQSAVEQVLAQGETSGADTLAGFVTAYELLF